MRLVVAAAVLCVSGLAVAGDGPTLAPAPLTAQQVALKFFSNDEIERLAAGEALRDASPQFLREVLSAAWKLRGPVPVSVELMNEGTSTEPPDLPLPGSDGERRGQMLEVRFLQLTQDGARTALGEGFSSEKPVARPRTSEEVTRLLALVQKSEDVRQITASTMAVRNAQRATVEMMNTTTYVADYEQYVGDWKPIVKNIGDGAVVEALPFILEDHRLRLDLSVKVHRLTRPIEQQEISAAGSPKPLVVQFPEVITAEWMKSVIVPDGGSVLVGGWAMDGTLRGGHGVLAVLLTVKAIDLSAPRIETKPPPPAPGAGEKPSR